MTGAWRVRLGREPNRFSPLISRVNEFFSTRQGRQGSQVRNRPATPVRRRRRTMSDTSANISDHLLSQAQHEIHSPAKPRANTSHPPIHVLENPDADRIERIREHCQCTICLGIPGQSESIYQCKMGHIYCERCLGRLIADGVILGGGAACATCRSNVEWQHVVRNRAVEMTASELPQDCQFCFMTVHNTPVKAHEDVCCLRNVDCQYKWAGCRWKGRQGQAVEHHRNCDIGQLPLSTTMQNAKTEIEKVKTKRHDHKQILNLYNSANCWYQDVYLKAYRLTDYGPGRLRFVSAEFAAFDLSWKMVGTIVSVEKNPSRPTHGEDRSIELQLTATSLAFDQTREINYVILKSPKSTVDIIPQQYTHAFSEGEPTSSKQKLMVKETNDYNRLIGSQSIYLRIVMFDDGRTYNNNTQIASQ